MMISQQGGEVEGFSWSTSRKEQENTVLKTTFQLEVYSYRMTHLLVLWALWRVFIKKSQVILVWSSWRGSFPLEWRVYVESSEMWDVPGLCGMILC